MEIEVRTIFVVLCASLLVACSSSPTKTPSPQNERENRSLFQTNTTPDTGSFPYQEVYPGDSIDTSALVIGLDAAMSGDFAKSGVSIWRGMVLAVDAINENGGLLGHQLQVLVKDHRANPARGRENIQNFAERENLLAVMGGMHTPVIMHELPVIHENKIISLVPWAAGTPIVDNDYDPNYVFRLSVRDEYAGPYLVDKLTSSGYDNPALFLENTDWGRSNRTSLTNALKDRGLSPASVSWFNWTEQSFREQIEQANANDADVVIFVGNSPEGVSLVESMAQLNQQQRLPILSHWGITGGNFFEKTRSSLPNVTVRVLQTRSLLDPANPDPAESLTDAYCKKFNCEVNDSLNISSPVGTAHAHDVVHLLARAVKQADSVRRPEIRKTLENLGAWDGVVRSYDRPFTPDDHEALTMNDLRIARYNSEGNLVLGELK